MRPRATKIIFTSTAAVWMLSTACLSAPANRAASVRANPGGGETRPRANYLSAADLQSVSSTSALEAVRKLRPEFLRPSSRVVSFREALEPVLWVDDVHNGEMSLLNTIPIDRIRNITYLSLTEARLRFGAGCRCGSGVLAVKTDQGR